MNNNELKLRRLIAKEVKKILNEERRNHLRESKRSRFPKLVDLIFEDASPDKVDLPTNLSDIAKDAEKMKARVTTGADDNDGGDGDDVIKSNTEDISVTELKPSQSTMEIKKAVEFSFSALLKTNPMPDGPGGAVGAIISNDLHIMDGHHRWIASLMIDPASSMTGPVVNFPASKLIPVLNLLTVGMFGRGEGQKGEGTFDDFNKEKLKPIVMDVLENGYWAEKNPEKCKAVAVEFTGLSAAAANDKIADVMADKMVKNINSSANWKQLPDGAPPRNQMPVIKPEEVDNAVAALSSGQVDVNPPYGGEKEGEKAPENASRLRRGDVVVERWQKLAGIIK